MKVRFKEYETLQVTQGCLVQLDDGRVRYIVEDEGDFFFVNLADAQQTTCKYPTIEELLEGYKVVKVVPPSRLVVSEI